MTTHTIARKNLNFTAIGIFFATALLLAAAPTSQAASKGTVATQTIVNPGVAYPSKVVCQGAGGQIGGPVPQTVACYNHLLSASVVAEGGELRPNGGTVNFHINDGYFLCSAPVVEGTASCWFTPEPSGYSYYSTTACLCYGLTADYSGYSGPPGWRYLPSSGSFSL